MLSPVYASLSHLYYCRVIFSGADKHARTDWIKCNGGYYHNLQFFLSEVHTIDIIQSLQELSHQFKLGLKHRIIKVEIRNIIRHKRVDKCDEYEGINKDKG